MYSTFDSCTPLHIPKSDFQALKDMLDKSNSKDHEIQNYPTGGSKITFIMQEDDFLMFIFDEEGRLFDLRKKVTPSLPKPNRIIQNAPEWEVLPAPSLSALDVPEPVINNPVTASTDPNDHSNLNSWLNSPYTASATFYPQGAGKTALASPSVKCTVCGGGYSYGDKRKCWCPKSALATKLEAHGYPAKPVHAIQDAANPSKTWMVSKSVYDGIMKNIS